MHSPGVQWTDRGLYLTRESPVELRPHFRPGHLLPTCAPQLLLVLFATSRSKNSNVLDYFSLKIKALYKREIILQALPARSSIAAYFSPQDQQAIVLPGS